MNVKMTPKVTRKRTHRISARKRYQMRVLERHRRRCLICHHPERVAIEEEFLHWRGVWELAKQYNLADYRTIYRHARATRLLLKRRENLHAALDCIVEWSEDVRPTADSILRAMRAYSCIDRHGRWTDLPTQVNFVSSRTTRRAKPAAGSKVIDIEPDELDEALEDAEPDEVIADDAQPDEDAESTEAEEDAESAEAEDDAESEDDSLEDSESQVPRSGATACAASPAQALVGANRADAVQAEPDEAEEDTELDEVQKEAEPDEAQENAEPDEAVGEHLEPALEIKPASPRDRTTCAVSPAQAVPRVRGHNPQSRSVYDRTACAALPAQSAPPPPERSPYYTELVITSAPKHSPATNARPDIGMLPPEPRRASPQERRDADLRRALPHPPHPSQPLQAEHYLELLDRCLNPVAARKLRPVGRRTRKSRRY
jgi:hypothetical protein